MSRKSLTMSATCPARLSCSIGASRRSMIAPSFETSAARIVAPERSTPIKLGASVFLLDIKPQCDSRTIDDERAEGVARILVDCSRGCQTRRSECKMDSIAECGFRIADLKKESK